MVEEDFIKIIEVDESGKLKHRKIPNYNLKPTIIKMIQ